MVGDCIVVHTAACSAIPQRHMQCTFLKKKQHSVLFETTITSI